jgi:hypothetical protein
MSMSAGLPLLGLSLDLESFTMDSDPDVLLTGCVVLGKSHSHLSPTLISHKVGEQSC